MDGLEAVELRLSEVLVDNIVFRIEAEFYKKIYLENHNKFKDNPTLRDFSNKIVCGPFGSAILDETYKEFGVKVIRPFNIKNLLIEKENIVYIDKEDIQLKNLKLFTKNTIFFSRVGDIKCGIHIDDEEVTISPNIIAVEVNDNKYNPFFLTLFFNTKFGFLQIQRELKISAQPTISTLRLQNLKLPIININFQINIEKFFIKSNEMSIKSEILYKQSEQLLLKELDLLDFKPSKENIAIKSFSESFGDSGRLDSEYYQPKYDEIIEKIKGYRGGYNILSNEFKIINGKTPKKYTNSGIKVIKTKNIRIPTVSIDNIKDYVDEELIVTQEKDLIFASMGVGSLGRISYVDKISANCNIDGTLKIFRIKKDNNLEIPTMIFLTSKIGQELIYKYIIGSTGIISISNQNINNLTIPNINSELAKKLTTIVLESIKLKEESKQLLEVAKRAVEIAIEEGEDVAINLIKKERL